MFDFFFNNINLYPLVLGNELLNNQKLIILAFYIWAMVICFFQSVHSLRFMKAGAQFYSSREDRISHNLMPPSMLERNKSTRHIVMTPEKVIKHCDIWGAICPSRKNIQP